MAEKKTIKDTQNKKIFNSGKGREEIKEKFVNGKIPTESDFALLIDSMVNQQDDGFEKDDENGFIITPPPGSNKFFAFKKEINDKQLFFSIEKDESKSRKPAGDGDAPGEDAKENADTAGNDDGYMVINPNPEGNKGEAAPGGFYFHKNGNFGVGKACETGHKMEVDGFFAADSRIGSYKANELPPDKTLAENNWAFKGQVPADGKWYKIIDNLNNCNAFEIVARCGKVNKNNKTGKYALLHAIAVSSFGSSHSRIRKTSSCYGLSLLFWLNRINLKWTGTTHNYSLWIKTNSHYGKDEEGNITRIFYRITRLWDDNLFTEPGYYY